MRLINGDELIAVFNSRSTINVVGDGLCKVIITRIEALPTVDAIPIEWMLKWDETLTDESMEIGSTVNWNIVKWMILEWRKDNG